MKDVSSIAEAYAHAYPSIREFAYAHARSDAHPCHANADAYAAANAYAIPKAAESAVSDVDTPVLNWEPAP